MGRKWKLVIISVLLCIVIQFTVWRSNELSVGSNQFKTKTMSMLFTKNCSIFNITKTIIGNREIGVNFMQFILINSKMKLILLNSIVTTTNKIYKRVFWLRQILFSWAGLRFNAVKSYFIYNSRSFAKIIQVKMGIKLESIINKILFGHFGNINFSVGLNVSKNVSLLRGYQRINTSFQLVSLPNSNYSQNSSDNNEPTGEVGYFIGRFRQLSLNLQVCFFIIIGLIGCVIAYWGFGSVSF